MSEIKIEGLEEMQQKLETLSNNLKSKYTNKALKAGAEPILQKMKDNCPIGHFAPHAKEYLTASDPVTEDGEKIIKVGIQKDDNSMAFYLKFAEWGWTVPFERVMNKKSGHAYIRKIKNGGHKIAPKPFMEPAFNQTKDEAIEKIAESLREDLKL